MPSLVRHKNGYHYIVYRSEGKQKWKSLRTRDKKQARILFDEFDARYKLGLIGLPDRRSAPLIRDLLNEYVEYHKAHSARRTWKHAELYARLFLIPFFGHIPADKLTSHNIEEFIRTLKEWVTNDGDPAPYGSRTINLRLSCLRACLRRAVDNKVINSIPCKIELLRETRPLPKYITPREFALWSAQIQKPINRCRAVIELCTGIPDSELGKMTWRENYNEDMGILKYRREKTDIDIVVKLNQWALETIGKLKEISSGVFIFGGVKDIKKAYQVASKNSGINVTPHMLRHSFATWALSAGEPIANVSAILGHTSIGTTQIYARVMPSFLERTTGAIDSMRPADVKIVSNEKPIRKAKPKTDLKDTEN